MLVYNKHLLLNMHGINIKIMIMKLLVLLNMAVLDIWAHPNMTSLHGLPL